jgi:hypothetical protein
MASESSSRPNRWAGDEKGRTMLTRPSEHELLEFFGVAAIGHDAKEGFSSYEVPVTRGLHLRFSFNVFEVWLRTEIVVGEDVIASVTQEGASRITIEKRPAGPTLMGECDLGTAVSRVEILMTPHPSFRWSTLLTE